MANNTVIIGSVLKPVDDVRHYEKFAKTISSPSVNLHIFGYGSATQRQQANIRFHGSKHFGRLSFTRLWRPVQFLWLCLKLRPKLIICCTHELLAASVWAKWLTGAKLLYDVQENYYYNVRYTTAFPALIRRMVAWFVKTNEAFYARFCDHFTLAERCYEYELSFLKKGRYTIVENKYQPLDGEKASVPAIDAAKRFLMTGTLGDHFGTKEGLQLFSALKALNGDLSLDVLGVCRDASLRSLIDKKSTYSEVSDEPLPHHKIIERLRQGGIALCPYQPNRSTRDKIPTKFYEYLHFRIPMIVQHNSVWEAFLTPYHAAVFIDFASFDAQKLWQELQNTSFYDGKPVGDEIYWDSEAGKLLNIELLKELNNA